MIKMYRKTPVEDETESLSQDEILWGEVMLVDPRDYEIHEFNIRTQDLDRGIKSLEDSILEVGFRFPSRSDENKKLIDGGRRWRIAMKHMLKMPMVHIRYGDGQEGSQDRIIDSIIGNLGIPNSPKELGKAVNLLVSEFDMQVSEIARRLGLTVNIVNNWAISHKIPKELLPEENPEVEEIWDGLTPSEIKTFETIRRATDLSPKERIEQLKDYTKMTFSAKDALARDVQDGGTVDIKARLAVTAKKYSHVEFDVSLELWKDTQKMLRMRAWDKQILLKVVLKMIRSGRIQISQEDYMELGYDEDS